MNWRKATPDQTLGDGDQLLVTGKNDNGRRWIDLIDVNCGEDYFELCQNGESADLLWSDIEYWCYADEIPEPEAEKESQ